MTQSNSVVISQEEIENTLAELICGKNDNVDNSKNYELIKKLSAELNSQNNSTFENVMGKLVDRVDIDKGVKKLLSLSENSSEEDKLSAKIQSGLDYVIRRIKHYLIKSNIASNVLVEYSLLSSTLDPDNPDKLQCCSFVIGDRDFKYSVDNCYTSCIDYTAADRKKNPQGMGLSIYQHPHFLYNIPIKERTELGNADLSVDDGTKTKVICDGKGLTISVKRGTVKDTSYCIKEDDKSGGNFKDLNDGSNISIEAFTLNRPFKEMLLRAKNYDPDKEPSLEEIQNVLHSYCHRNITCDDSRVKDKDEKTSVYVSFPIYGSRASNQLPQYAIKNADGVIALQGIGACFIYFEPQNNTAKSPVFNRLVELIIEKIAYEIGKFVRFVSANYMFNLGLQLQENARKEALKSARSAIMSRNMSHNLGSHVMSYLKQSLSSVQRILDDRLLALLFENNEDMLNSVKEELCRRITKEEDEKGALPFLVGLGKFISYLQERQDFIATIATDYFPYLSTVNLKDFIYDELNPDKRYERHKDRKNFKTDNILLGNIARSEGLGRPTSPTITLSKDGKETPESNLNDIVIKFRSFDGNPVKNESGKVINSDGERDLQSMRAYDFSLPGGVVGRQALFSIIENIIRNAAKHGNWRNKGQLELSLDIFTKEEVDLYNEICQVKNRIESPNKGENSNELKEILAKKEGEINKQHPNIESKLFDKIDDNNLSLIDVFNRFYVNAADAKDLYFITLTDNLSMDTDKLEKLRKAIKEPLINERGEMNEASKGIKEMKISSSWIRNLNEGDAYNPVKFEENNSQKLCAEKKWDCIEKAQYAPALYARITKGRETDGDNHLQYIFCVLRPKKVAIVSSRFPKNEENPSKETLKKIYNLDAFLRYSWTAFHPEDFIKEKNKSYEFVIYDEESDMSDSWWLDMRYVSSLRLLKLKETPLHDTLFANISRVFGCTEEEQVMEKLFYDDMLCQLYRSISNYKEKDDFLLIDDGKTAGRVEIEKTSLTNVKIVNGEKGLNTVDASRGEWYIYRSHHETSKEFYKFMSDQDGKKFKHGVYVEGITGNNSTDRLIRNEKIDEGWFYRHLHAMKEKIAIFDERIFTKCFGLGEADLIESFKVEQDLVPWLDKYLEKNIPLDKIGEWLDVHRNDWREIVKKEYSTELSHCSAIIKSVDRANAKTEYIPTAISQKGIYIFTIIRDPEQTNKFNLYGLSQVEKDGIVCAELEKESDNKCVSICKKLAVIGWTNNQLDITWRPGIEYYKKKFDLISIHQGLLDKLYTVFGIKDNSVLKEELTNKFYMEFSVNKEDEKNRRVVIEQECNKLARVIKESSLSETEDGTSDKKIISDHPFYLLPGMCIHSGRSKPSKIDMPQQLPFIQYASIENAVLDCKYSLVELLDYARYE